MATEVFGITLVATRLNEEGTSRPPSLSSFLKEYKTQGLTNDEICMGMMICFLLLF